MYGEILETSKKSKAKMKDFTIQLRVLDNLFASA